MKYENLKEIQSTVKQIDRLEKELNELQQHEAGQVKVTIYDMHGKSITTIGANHSFEHHYSKLAELFVQSCITLCTKKIDDLKKHLEKL